ncbi:Spore cortex-lytic enzyme precursor [Clostridium sp. C105KSO15]|nr:Spore cortex-lytic enzyme precursor [Clostridium sp. C105KSO15]
MRKLITVGMTSLCLAFTMPMATWANNIEETVTTAQFEEALPYVTDFTLKYANQAGVNIREEPNTRSKILGRTLLNTTFEVVLDIGGWSMISTEDGYAYIKSEFLNDDEVKYTTEDLYIMAHVLAGEAQFCDDTEQKYVGSVVLNRVAHSEYPDTIKGVVFEKKQYSSVADGNYNRKPTESNWTNAKWLLENGSILPGYVVYQSKGKQGHGVYLKTKWHQYCY